jgi:hypothetical protein
LTVAPFNLRSSSPARLSSAVRIAVRKLFGYLYRQSGKVGGGSDSWNGTFENSRERLFALHAHEHGTELLVGESGIQLHVHHVVPLHCPARHGGYLLRVAH